MPLVVCVELHSKPEAAGSLKFWSYLAKGDKKWLINYGLLARWYGSHDEPSLKSGGEANNQVVVE